MSKFNNTSVEFVDDDDFEDVDESSVEVYDSLCDEALVNLFEKEAVAAAEQQELDDEEEDALDQVNESDEAASQANAGQSTLLVQPSRVKWAQLCKCCKGQPLCRTCGCARSFCTKCIKTPEDVQFLIDQLGLSGFNSLVTLVTDYYKLERKPLQIN